MKIVTKNYKAYFKYLYLLFVIVLTLGVFFRFVNLDKKVYWIDEVHTSLRVSGYKKTEFVDKAPVNRILKIADLQKNIIDNQVVIEYVCGQKNWVWVITNKNADCILLEKKVEDSVLMKFVAQISNAETSPETFNKTSFFVRSEVLTHSFASVRIFSSF